MGREKHIQGLEKEESRGVEVEVQEREQFGVPIMVPQK